MIGDSSGLETVSGRVLACISFALISATRAGNAGALKAQVLPAILSVSWRSARGCDLIAGMATAAAKLPALGLADEAAKVLVALSSTVVNTGAESPACAFVVAKYFAGEQHDATHGELANSIGAPTDPSNLPPRGVISAFKKARITAPQANQYLNSAFRSLFLLSKSGSLKQTAAALRSWGGVL